jgi:superfamily II DNA or RNA helicase
VADVSNAMNHCLMAGMQTTGFRLAKMEVPLVITVKPCAHFVTLKKEKMMHNNMGLPPLHRWQKEALDKFHAATANNEKDFLVSVSGGGGKTRWALEVAQIALTSKQQGQIIVVTYTSHLVTQWEKAASKHGLKLFAAAGNSKLKKGLPEDCNGYICTFAAVGRMPDLHAAFAGANQTLVIFDEIHHLGDRDEEEIDFKWGPAAKIAFSRASFRLALSGTPFRSNNERIPFVKYESLKGSNIISEVIPDYSYSYGEAVADGICRRVIFQEVDGPIEWEENGINLLHKFKDKIDPNLWGPRLRFAASGEPDDQGKTKSQLLEDLLKRAVNKLNDVRKAGHHDAGGLIVTNSIIEAKLTGDILRRLIGYKPVIVHNDEERSLKNIVDFTNGIMPWIISVKMITEGVDIPRLRLCAYVSVTTEDLFVMQVIFRIVRKSQNHFGESYFFYPADERLIDITKEIEKEIETYAREKEKKKRSGTELTRIDRNFIGAEAETWTATIAGEVYSDEDITIAEAFRNQHESLKNLSITDLVKFYYQYRKYQQKEQEPSGYIESYNESRERLRGTIQTKVGHLHNLTDYPYNKIHYRLNQLVGTKDKDTATVEQLEKMLHVVNEFITEAENGN